MIAITNQQNRKKQEAARYGEQEQKASSRKRKAKRCKKLDYKRLREYRSRMESNRKKLKTESPAKKQKARSKEKESFKHAAP